jgi:hypothetical protein
MKTILTTLIFVSGMSCFAGTTTGAGPGFSKELNTSLVSIGNSSSEPFQVYFIRQKQSELIFAINIDGSAKVDIQAMRPEEIQNSAVLETLKKSQVTKQWEIIKGTNINSLRGLNDIQGLK